jgi:neutral/alkaline ceramidase-like enzyme
MKIIGMLAIVCAAATVKAGDIQLQAGVARAEITPASFMPMYGYNNRKCGPANGTHDPLFAKALVLATGESRLAIVTLDLGNIVSESLGPKVAAELGIPVLLLAASHTHSAPLLAPGSAELAEVEKKIFDAVERASKSMFPARLGIGRGSLQLGYNRLLPRDDGRARALFDNIERVPYGPVDPEYVLLSVEDLSGSARALLVHYACHAVVLGPTSCKYSADYPGAMQTKVESQMKGTQCMFVQGGAGDINPLFEGRTGKEPEDFATMQKMGELLADDVLRSVKKIHPASPMRYPIQAIQKNMTFSERWDKEKSLNVGVTTVLINREIGIATAPGEPMHKLQTMWKKEAPLRYPLFYGYTYSFGGDWAGYIPDLRSAAYGGYGADVTTRIEIGAGEQIIRQHLINAYQLLDMWRDKPGRP